MGGKGGSYQAPPAIDPNMVANAQAQTQLMMDAYQQQMQIIMQQALDVSIPEVDPLPELPPVETVNWDEKIAELNAKAKDQTQVEQERKKSVADTILTSPLLDDEEAETTQLSLLGK